MWRFGLVFALLAASCGTGEIIAPPAESPPTLAADASEPTASTAGVATPVVAEHHAVPADDGHPISVWEKRPADPRGVVVLVHGRTWSARPDFDLQVPGESRSTMDALVREGFSAYAVDLRGYGGTERDDTGWNTPNRAAADVVAVLAFARTRNDAAEPPALLGWSLGSLTTQLVAQRHPDDVSAAILYGYPRRHDHKYEPGPPASTKPPRAKTTAKAAAEDFIIPGSISQAAIDTFVKSALASDPIKADWRALEEWNELDPGKLRVPTLLIHGERDPYAPARAQAELFARIAAPDREYVVVAGGDHAAHLEDSGPRFVQAVVAFLERPRPSRPPG